MPRPRHRACLEHGLKLDINKLARQRLLQPWAKVGPNTIRWTNSYTGETIAAALITTHLQSDYGGCLRIQMGELEQWIDLVAQRRHFGGRQWYFKSPITHRCSVLWMPPGDEALLWTPRMGKAGRLRLAVRYPRGSGASRKGENQSNVDR